MEISHYGASWVNSQDFPYPRWPYVSYNALLSSPNKKGMPPEVCQPLIITGPFPQNCVLRFRLGTVSYKANILVKIDDNPVFDKVFVPQGGKGEWQEAIFSEKYGIYQNLYELDFEVPIPNKTQTISITNIDGDWATITELEFLAPSQTAYAVGVPDWQGQSSKQLRYEKRNGIPIINGGTVRDKQWLWNVNVKPWQKAERQGIGVMIGEFGAHNLTPHQIVLDWMEDMLSNWNEAGWGWALWNFRGSFGIADSGRKDVNYVDWRGLKLDRKMLKLLQQY